MTRLNAAVGILSSFSQLHCVPLGVHTFWYFPLHWRLTAATGTASQEGEEFCGMTGEAGCGPVRLRQTPPAL